jgi:hypothetical protein
MSETQDSQNATAPEAPAPAPQAPASPDPVQSPAPEAQAPASAPPTMVVTLKLKPEVQKAKDYVSGLSDRALMGQIKSQEKDGEKADVMYSSMLQAELQKRQEKAKQKKG